MAVLPILLYPNPLLKQVSEVVNDFDVRLRIIVKDLEDTLEASPFCVGIAAPQIGYLDRVLLIDLSRSRKPMPNKGRLLLINPKVLFSSGQIIAREGCLSLPDLTANVSRASEIELEFYSSAGEKQIIRACEFEARVILHELDHLDGLLFLDRVTSLKTDVFRRKKY